MRTNQNQIEFTHVNAGSISRLSNDETRDALRQSGNSQKLDLDYLSEIERELKVLWSEYILCHEKYGFNDTTQALREKYFNLLRSYRNNKNWKQMISSN